MRMTACRCPIRKQFWRDSASAAASGMEQQKPSNVQWPHYCGRTVHIVQHLLITDMQNVHYALRLLAVHVRLSSVVEGK